MQHVVAGAAHGASWLAVQRCDPEHTCGVPSSLQRVEKGAQSLLGGSCGQPTLSAASAVSATSRINALLSGGS